MPTNKPVFVAGLPTDAERLGETVKRLYDVDAKPIFDDLLKDVDAADSAFKAQQHSSGTISPPPKAKP